MSNTGRRIYAVLAALAVAWTIVFLIETLANRMAPLPPGVNPLDSDQLKRALEAGEIPFSSLALVLGGWLLGAYAGGTVAARLGGPGKAALVFCALYDGGRGESPRHPAPDLDVDRRWPGSPPAGARRRRRQHHDPEVVPHS